MGVCVKRDDNASNVSVYSLWVLLGVITTTMKLDFDFSSKTKLEEILMKYRQNQRQDEMENHLKGNFLSFWKSFLLATSKGRRALES